MLLLLLFLFVLIPCKCKVGGLNNTGLEADIFFFFPLLLLSPFSFFSSPLDTWLNTNISSSSSSSSSPPKVRRKEKKNPLLLQPHLPSKRSPSSKIATRSFTPLRRRIRSASCRSSRNKSPLENHHCALQKKF